MNPAGQGIQFFSAKKKTKQAVRRLSQSRKRQLSSSSLGTPTSPVPPSSSSTSSNPFLAALKAKNNQMSERPTSTTDRFSQATPNHNRPMMSYAAAVRGDPPLEFKEAKPSSIAERPPNSSTSLHVKRIPNEYNNEDFLYNHFNAFGPVDSIECNPHKLFADVHFADKESAVKAKRDGRYLSDDVAVEIYWYSAPPKGIVRSPRFVGNQQQLVDPRLARKRTRRPEDDEEEEYVPSQVEEDQYQLQEEEDDSNVDEINEGRDSVLIEIVPQDENQMDTIARVPIHNYYLRSLHQPEPSTSTGFGDDEESHVPRLNLPHPPPPRSNTASDCFEALDARDKEIRRGIIKDTSLVAKAKVGCCPDMCPEKERYEREYQRRLSIFEVSNGERDYHSLAVKEYSRAAADKEEPLPHELRPLPVLMMTMDYIMTRIFDEGLSHVREWYHFIWDRTRSIATDMVYQQLCEPNCALLLERFARFHILCSYILCEEEISTFDPKMNTQTTAGHLQSLKQMYHDLSHKGITCENEPEFCCYDILLNLMDGSVLDKIKHYSPSIRSSHEVTFALMVVQAVNDNNFVKFFKLVRQSSFLCACILHRYFSQIRLKALQTLNNALSPGAKHITNYSLDDLMRILAFSTEYEAGEFCVNVGLDIVKDKIKFQRGKMVDFVEPLGIKKEDELILLKNDEKFSQVVYGGPLPPPPDHTPHCSFTDQSPLNQAVATHQVVPPQYTEYVPIFTEQDIIGILNEIQLDVLPDEIRLVVEEFITQEEINTVVANFVLQDISVGVVDEACLEVCQDFMSEMLRKKEQSDYEKMKQSYASTLSYRIRDNVMMKECRLVVMETMTEIRMDLEVKENVLNGSSDVLMEDVWREMMREVAIEVFQEQKQTRRKQLQESERQLKLYKLRNCWKKWSVAYSRCQYVKRVIKHFPSTGPLTSLGDQLDNMTLLSCDHHMTSHVDSSSLERKHLTIPIVNDTHPLQPISSIWKDYEDYQDSLLSPVDFRALCRERFLPRHHGDNIGQCNLVMVGDDAATGHDMWAWLQRKMSGNPDVHMMSLAEYRMGVSCMASSIILFCPEPGVATYEAYSRYLIESIITLSEHAQPFARVPLVILTPSPLDPIHQSIVFSDNKVINNNVFNEIMLDNFPSSNDLSANTLKLMEILRLCIQYSFEVPAIRVVNFKHYLHQCILDNFITHVTTDSTIRQQHKLPSQPPGLIIHLYNFVLKYIIDKLTPPIGHIPFTIGHCPATTCHWFPPDKSTLRCILNLLTSLQLPHPSSCNVDSVHDCLLLVETISSNVSLLSRVKALIGRAVTIQWSQIIIMCINQLLEDSCISDELMLGIPYMEMGDHFVLPASWASATIDTSLLQNRVARKRHRHSDPVTHPSASACKLSKLNKTLQGPIDDFNNLVNLEVVNTIEYDSELQEAIKSPVDSDHTVAPSCSVVPPFKLGKKKSIRELIDSLEIEIKLERLNEKTDRATLQSVL